MHCSLLVFCLVPLPLFILQPRNPTVMSCYSNPGVSSLPRSLTKHSTIIRQRQHNQAGLKRTGGKSDKTASLTFQMLLDRQVQLLHISHKTPPHVNGKPWNSSRALIAGPRQAGKQAYREECGCSHAHFFQVGPQRHQQPAVITPNLTEERRECEAE